MNFFKTIKVTQDNLEIKDLWTLMKHVINLLPLEETLMLRVPNFEFNY